jgi:DNA-binding NtrC family response regulator
VALLTGKDEIPSRHEYRNLIEVIVAKSAAMYHVFDIMHKAAPTDANVLIYGESGTGKELIARGIHNLSRRKRMAFVAVDCVAVPSSLLESELFGYEKGAFTGAIGTKHGLFEIADQGTFFMNKFAKANGLAPKLFHPETIQALQNFHWPGNVRELQNVIERVVALCRDNIILPEDLPSFITRGHPTPSLLPASMLEASTTWKEYQENLKYTYFKTLLEKTHGNLIEVARQADVTLRTVYQIIHRYKLNGVG